jgi:hypothetical protein
MDEARSPLGQADYFLANQKEDRRAKTPSAVA